MMSLNTGLINMYIKCGSVEDAYKVFNRMYDHDFVCWTTMVMSNMEKHR